MQREHTARIVWSDAHVRRGLVARTEWIAPAWFVGDPPDADGWSLVCRCDVPPATQGSPSTALSGSGCRTRGTRGTRGTSGSGRDATSQLATVEGLD